jgi:hypothetical protein
MVLVVAKLWWPEVSLLLTEATDGSVDVEAELVLSVAFVAVVTNVWEFVGGPLRLEDPSLLAIAEPCGIWPFEILCPLVSICGPDWVGPESERFVALPAPSLMVGADCPMAGSIRFEYALT